MNDGAGGEVPQNGDGSDGVTRSPDGWLPAQLPDTIGATAAGIELAQLIGGITDGRIRIRLACDERRALIEDLDQRVRTLDKFSNDVRAAISGLARYSNSGKVMRRANERATSGASRPGTVTVTRTEHGYFVTGQGANQTLQKLNQAASALSAAQSKKLTGGRQRDEAEDLIAEAELTLRGVTAERDRLRILTGEERNARTTAIRTDAEALTAWATALSAQLARSASLGTAPGRPGWDPQEWWEWSEPDEVQPVHLGRLVIRRDDSLEEWAAFGEGAYPVTADLRALSGLHIRHDQETRAEAHAAARGLLARLLAAVPPGKARFTFFDPLGLGQAVSPFLALADHDPKLIDGKVWTNAESLRNRLTELSAHIENVIQKYLRGQYETIEEFNAAAGEIAEPYRVLVVFDFPSVFDEATFHHLCRVIENGPRCGVYTVLVTDLSVTPPYGVGAQGLPAAFPTYRIGHQLALMDGQGESLGRATLAADGDPLSDAGAQVGQGIIDRIVDAVGRSGRGADNVVVTFERSMSLYSETAMSGVRADIPPSTAPVDPSDPSTWWRGVTRDGVVAPIGQSGARDVAALRFDSETQAGALLVGRPGSGKSTLLHSYLAGLATLYPPEELDLYLIDFKEGVEFKAYGEYGLPHARCVAVESEREFGLSVLESIVEEMRRRAELIRSAGGQYTTFANARDASSDPLPRVLLVFDEFHVLFAEDDRLGATAASHLETIVRQGRGFGVHMILGSQSLAGLDALPRHVLQLLPIRILLPSSEADAQTVLGEGNNAWKLLSRRGEGLLNPSAGAVEANVVFQTSFQTDDERRERLITLRNLADQRGIRRRPVVFEGAAAAHLDAEPPEQVVADLRSAGAIPRLRIGAPMSLAGPVDVELRRESGSNVLIVAKASNDVPLGIMTSSILSALTWTPMPRFEVIDFTSIDDGFEDGIAPFVAQGLTVTRRRRAAAALTTVADEVTRRIDQDDTRAFPYLLFLNGLHRARDLDPFGSSDPFAAPEDAGDDLLGLLRRILVDGPDVGVHTVAWVDSVASLQRRLPTDLRREFAHRVVGNMSRDDSVSLIDVDLAASCKTHQVIVFHDDTGVARRANAYGPPDHTWFTGVLDTIARGLD